VTLPRTSLRDQPPLPENERPEIPSRLSQTFLRHFANCRRSAAFYLLFGGGPGSHEMDRGTAAHMIAERMGKHALEYGEPTVPHEVVREIVNEVIAEPELTIAPSQEDFLHTIAYHLAEALTFDPETIVGLERKVVLELGGWRIVGKIDLAWVQGERAGVNDYKTSMNLPDNSAWGPGETDDGKKRIRRLLFQTLLYALLLKYGRPVVPCEACGGRGGGEEQGTCDVCEGEGEIIEDTPLAPRAQLFDLAEVYPAYMWEDENGAKKLAARETTIKLEELENHRRWLEALIGKVDHAFATGEWPGTTALPDPRRPARQRDRPCDWRVADARRLQRVGTRGARTARSADGRGRPALGRREGMGRSGQHDHRRRPRLRVQAHALDQRAQEEGLERLGRARGRDRAGRRDRRGLRPRLLDQGIREHAVPKAGAKAR
jgi:hypothetical protein